MTTNHTVKYLIDRHRNVMTFHRKSSYPTGLENVQSWQSWQNWTFESVEQQKCLLPGQRASRTSSPEQCCEPGNELTLETGQQHKKRGLKHFSSQIQMDIMNG